MLNAIFTKDIHNSLRGLGSVAAVGSGTIGGTIGGGTIGGGTIGGGAVGFSKIL